MDADQGRTNAAVPDTPVRAGIVDVLVLARTQGPAADWAVLALRRAPGTRCTGAWEIVHGRIERGELPAVAAVREVREETGLGCDRLYSITVNPFYLQSTGSVELAIVFAAVVSVEATPTLSGEHDEWEWLTRSKAKEQLAWPREREALFHALSLLASGDAGHLEDVLRVF
ncbi:MAG: NUDIX domain-containing protein [Gemmatimonas sp.]